MVTRHYYIGEDTYNIEAAHKAIIASSKVKTSSHTNQAYSYTLKSGITIHIGRTSNYLSIASNAKRISHALSELETILDVKLIPKIERLWIIKS